MTAKHIGWAGLITKNPILSEVNQYLIDWKRATKNEKGIRGHPKRSSTELANEGGLSVGAVKPPTDLSEKDLLTDVAMARLRARNHSILYRALHGFYEKELPMEGVAFSLGFGKDRQRAEGVVKRGLIWIYIERENIQFEGLTTA